MNVTLEVTAFQDPETAPEGDPYDLEVPVEMSLVYSEAGTTWGGDTEAGEKVKDALKMTTYQFSQALESGDIQLYINEVTDPAPTQCWAGEFFVDGEGTVVSEEAAASYIVGFYPDGTDLYVEVGNIPANTAVGDVLNIKLIAVAKGVTVTLPITVEITE